MDVLSPTKCSPIGWLMSLKLGSFDEKLWSDYLLKVKNQKNVRSVSALVKYVLLVSVTRYDSAIH